MFRRNNPTKTTAVRRIVKTVTEEIVEVLVPAHPPTNTIQGRLAPRITPRLAPRLAPRNTTVQAQVKRDVSNPPRTLSYTKRATPAVQKTIVKRSTVKKTPFRGVPFSEIPTNGTAVKETLAKQTPAEQPLARRTLVDKPRQPRNHLTKALATRDKANSTVKKNNTPEPPKTPHTTANSKHFDLRTALNLKRKEQAAQPKARPAKCTLQSAIAKGRPVASANRRAQLVSHSNKSNRSPSRNLAAVLAPALYNSQLPAHKGPRTEPPSNAHPYSTPSTPRSVHGCALGGKQAMRKSAEASSLGAAVKLGPKHVVKRENLIVPLSSKRPIDGSMGKMKQTARRSLGAGYKRVAIKPEPERVAVEPEPERVAVEPEPERVAVKPEPERVAVKPEPERVAIKPEPERMAVKSEIFIAPPLRMDAVRKVKQTARKSPGTGISPTASTARTTRVFNRARSPSTGREASAARTPGIWAVTHESGYHSDESHSYLAPVSREIGTYTTRAAAIEKGKQIVGDDVGYSWQKVCDTGDLKVISDTQQKWEITWSPPDSQYSNVTVCFIPEGGGVWAVDVEAGPMSDRFHSYKEPTKTRVGLFLTRQLAVEEGKKRMEHACGWDWGKVVQNRFFDMRQDCAERWEGFWGPPDSEYTLVLVKRVAMPMGGVSETR